MHRLALAILVALAATATAKERDPDYERCLVAHRAKQWTELDRLAPAFLVDKPDYEFAHSVRFMIADSLHQRKRLPEAIAAYRDYLERHPDATLAGRVRSALLRALNENGEHEEALQVATAWIAAGAGEKEAVEVRYQRAIALEELRRFDEAAEAYAAITGARAEDAAFHLGVAKFRGRDFEGAQAALGDFLARYPNSSSAASARDYLFRTDTRFVDVRDGIVFDYHGKYESDPRFLAIRKGIAALREAALAELQATLGMEVSRSFLIRFDDAGSDRSGNFATTRLEVVKGAPRQVVILMTEYLVLDAHDLSRTLVHELHHCLQRESLGEDHFLAPKWVREGAALFVAGQSEFRTRLLAVEVGRRTNEPEPLDRLVNGLSGRHTYTDYAEDVAAFDAVEERHGREKAIALVRRLLTTVDYETAIREVLDEDFATFERAAADRARRVLAPLVGPGRDAVLLAARRGRERDWEGALAALPEDPGAYAPVALALRARALLETGKAKDALAAARDGFLARHRHYPMLLDDVIRVEAAALEALGAEDAAAVAARAKKDLTPCGGL